MFEALSVVEVVEQVVTRTTTESEEPIVFGSGMIVIGG